MASDDSRQTRVTTVLLAAIDDAGFVLAGAGAIRAHGITPRPTYDVDLFASSTLSEPAFATAVQTGTRALIDSGLQVIVVRSAPLFARLLVESPDGETIEVDLGVDWRQEPPVRLDVGPVLSLGTRSAARPRPRSRAARSATSSTSTRSASPQDSTRLTFSNWRRSTTRVSAGPCSRTIANGSRS